MAVNFTPNIGLAKPTGSELAKNWVELTQLQSDNNQIIINETNIPVTLYTPTIISTGATPNVGAGSIRGEYQDFNGIVTGIFNVEFISPGISTGLGDFAVSLPFPADGTFHSAALNVGVTPGQYSIIGEGYYYDSSNAEVSGHLALELVTQSGVSYVRMLTEIFTTPAKTGRFVSDSMPTPPSTGDAWVGNFMYKKA